MLPVHLSVYDTLTLSTSERQHIIPERPFSRYKVVPSALKAFSFQVVKERQIHVKVGPLQFQGCFGRLTPH